MKFAFKIVHKGILLVSVPVIIELLFFGYLIQLEQKIELQTKQETRSKAIIYETNELFTLIVRAVTSTVGLKVAGIRNELLSQSLPGSFRYSIKEKFDNLYANVSKTNAEQRVQLDKLSRATNKLLDLVEHLDRTGTVPNENKQGMSGVYFGELMSFRRIQFVLHALETALDKFKAPERELSKRIAQEQEETRQQLRATAILAISTSIILAACLAVFFSSSITKRISVLVDNSRRLAGQEELKPPMKGNDEIAELDKSFHETAVLLGKAQQVKNDFYAMITHDLRSPLSAVFGAVTLIEDGVYGEVPIPVHEKIGMVQRNLLRLLSLINDLLDIEKLRAGKMPLEIAKQNSGDILNRAKESIEGLTVTKNIGIVIHNQPVEFDADGERVVQVIVNLVANAIKFSPKGSTITLECKQIDSWVEFSVNDQGRGIPKEALDRIFERFGQVSKADAGLGTGLGLAICKMIVDAHSGTISVETEEGKGSRFFFRLPLLSVA